VSARRNLNLLQARGLIREVTGQDRYRFWAIRV
jgi:Fe2+ or Zn2+ uptake regulation protein